MLNGLLYGFDSLAMEDSEFATEPSQLAYFKPCKPNTNPAAANHLPHRGTVKSISIFVSVAKPSKLCAKEFLEANVLSLSRA